MSQGLSRGIVSVGGRTKGMAVDGKTLLGNPPEKWLRQVADEARTVAPAT